MEVKRTLGSGWSSCNGFDGGDACETHPKSAIEFSLSDRARRSQAARSARPMRLNGTANGPATPSVNGGPHASEAMPASILRVAARRASRAEGQGGGAVSSDDLQLARALLEKAKRLPAVRQQMIERAREREESGVYNRAPVVDKTLERLIGDLAD